MKITTRDNWRVIAVLHPRQTKLSIGSLGFTDVWGDPLKGRLWGDPIELTIHPERLGDLGYVSMSDSLASNDVEGDYRRRCEIIRDGVLRHPNVIEARIECDEEHTCSHCGAVWEELDDSTLEEWRQDAHSISGEPVCCEGAIAEFRTAKNLMQLKVER